MSDFEKKFIFRQRQRHLTTLSVILLAPLILAGLSVLLLQIELLPAIASWYLTVLVSLPNWSLGLIYLLFPFISMYYSFKLARRGTLYRLRGFNRTVGVSAVVLLILELAVILIG